MRFCVPLCVLACAYACACRVRDMCVPMRACNYVILFVHVLACAYVCMCAMFVLHVFAVSLVLQSLK